MADVMTIDEMQQKILDLLAQIEQERAAWQTRLDASRDRESKMSREHDHALAQIREARGMRELAETRLAEEVKRHKATEYRLETHRQRLDDERHLHQRSHCREVDLRKVLSRDDPGQRVKIALAIVDAEREIAEIERIRAERLTLTVAELRYLLEQALKPTDEVQGE